MKPETTQRRSAALLWIVALAFVLVFAASHSPATLAASAAALGLLAAAFACCARTVALAGATRVAHLAATTRELHRETAFLPQRDPDAAGRPHPRAPGRTFATV
jgi:hypothetical protein